MPVGKLKRLELVSWLSSLKALQLHPIICRMRWNCDLVRIVFPVTLYRSIQGVSSAVGQL